MHETPHYEAPGSTDVISQGKNNRASTENLTGSTLFGYSNDRPIPQCRFYLAAVTVFNALGLQHSDMNRSTHLQLLAKYNQWMNHNLYSCAAQLSVDELKADKGAFFGSIFGTMNHLAVGDTIWLKRFATHPTCTTILMPIAETPMPTRLDETLFSELRELQAYRDWLDHLIVNLTDSLSENAFTQSLTYSNTKGIKATRNLHSLLIHFFNHQTHHRGQITTLLFQKGIDPGTTDLLALIPQDDAN